jgi:hypothetical protein
MLPIVRLRVSAQTSCRSEDEVVAMTVEHPSAPWVRKWRACMVSGVACISIFAFAMRSDAQVRLLAGRHPGNGAGKVDEPVISQAGHSHRLVGAVVGLVVGTGATYLVIHHGGSTSLCDRSSNQDALSSRECLGLVVLGGAIGAGVGAIIGGALRSGPGQERPVKRFRLQAIPGRPTRLGLRMTL